jgi:glycerophosphoryl diester phosphodiesterase
MRFSLFFAIVLLVSCQKKADYSGVRIIGHAASGLKSTTSLYHDNSAEAIAYAIGLEGIDGIEIDIQCSASQTAWLFHDQELSAETNGSGCINSVTDNYLSSLQYSTLEHESLLRLADIDFPFAERLLVLDVRSSNECLGQLLDQQFVIDAIEQALPAGMLPMVVTNTPEWVHGFFLKGWKVYYQAETPSAYLGSNLLAETSGVCIRNEYIGKTDVESIHAAGKEVIIFEVRSPVGIHEGFEKYPDYLMTDDLKATLIEKYR